MDKLEQLYKLLEDIESWITGFFHQLDEDEIRHSYPELLDLLERIEVETGNG